MCDAWFECPAFDSMAIEKIQLRVRSFMVMECSVIDACYLGLGTGDAAQAKFAQLKNACRAVQGCFTVLWHNSRLTTRENIKNYSGVCQC